VFINSPG